MRDKLLSDLDETIRQLLVRNGELDTGAVDISFEMPNREWSATLSKPTVNLYLYDIRENQRLRGMDWAVSRDEKGGATRKKNASRIDVSYLVTVWTNDTADGHRLLWYVLSTLFRYRELPEDVLCGRLKQQKYPITTSAAQSDGLFSNPADFWSALDNEIKPSVSYVVTLPLDTEESFTAPIVRTRVLRLTPPDAASEPEAEAAGRGGGKQGKK